MTEINGFKVLGSTEVVIGKVVEFSSDDVQRFKVVEYYINEYNTYLHTTIATFDMKPIDSSKDLLQDFKKILGNYVRVNDVYLDETTMEFLMSID